MQTKFIKEKYRWVLTLQAKRKLWLKLPYRLRLRIEHFCFVSKLISDNEKKISLTVFQAIKMPIYRKAGHFWTEIRKLNNPYDAFTNVPISKKDLVSSHRIDMFLRRVSNTSYPFINN